MSRAEEIHYKAVMAADNQEPPKDYAISAHADHFNGFVEGYIEGYHQAEKDMELTWEDIELIVNIDKDTDNEESIIGVRKNEDHYKEVLKRYLKTKGEK